MYKDSQAIYSLPNADAVMLVTGGSRGIGAATVRVAAAAGWRVAFSYLKAHETANKLAEELQQQGAKVLVVASDMTDANAVQHFFSTAQKHFGRIDALVNNAGMAVASSRFIDTAPERWRQLFMHNVFSAMLCSQAAIKHMPQGGCIVNVSSIAAKQGSPARYIDYAASKGALESFTVGLAREIAVDNIRVNAVRPGIVDTDIHQDSKEVMQQRALSIPMQRIAQPEEIAQAIVWLCSAQASYITGSIIDVTGGR